MEEKYYTNERNVQILISLMKAHGIRKAVLSPGTTNITFVASLMYDGKFELFSSVDERSAAYMACGLAAETGEPVILSCTGATASRNYMPGLTEAYYSKLPVIAVTSHQGDYRIGHLIPQNIDRRNPPVDIALSSVTLPVVKDNADARHCELEANKALLEMKRNGGGPIHINLITTYSKDFSVTELPHVQVIRRYYANDSLPLLSSNEERVAVFIGSHREFSNAETEMIDRFCSKYDAIVFCDHTSGYHGKYKFLQGLVFVQPSCNNELRTIGTLIHIGEVSGDYSGLGFYAKRVWRVSEDGELRDTFGSLTDVFQMKESDFFSYYANNLSQTHTGFRDLCYAEYDKIIDMLPELPFSNLWIAQQLSWQLPEGCRLHLGILNTLRSWNFFKLPENIVVKSNVGGFGIDGNMSSLIGASLGAPELLFFGIFGDLSFFYDMNVLGNRHIGSNVRILLINNGRGTEFRNYNHPGALFGESADAYIAAAGHFGNKSENLVKHYAVDLGFQYLSASTKDEFMNVVNTFVSPIHNSQPIIFECFTDSQDESDALQAIHSILPAEIKVPTTKEIVKDKVKNIIGKKGMDVINILRG